MNETEYCYYCRKYFSEEMCVVCCRDFCEDCLSEGMCYDCTFDPMECYHSDSSKKKCHECRLKKCKECMYEGFCKECVKDGCCPKCLDENKIKKKK